MDCPAVKKLIYLYHYDVVEEEERAEIDRHLAICASCRDLAEHSKKSLALLSSWKVENGDPELVSQTLGKIDSRREKSVSPSQLRGLSILRWAGIAAAILLCSVLFFMPGRREYDAPRLSEAPKESERSRMPLPEKDSFEQDKRDLPKSEAMPSPPPPYEEEAKTEMQRERMNPAEKEADDERSTAAEDVDEGEAPESIAGMADSPAGPRDRDLLPSIVKKGIRKPATKDNCGEFAKSDVPGAVMPTRAAVKSKRPEGNDALCEESAAFAENPFLFARENPVSTFPLTVEITSYVTCRSLIQRGILPPREEVRIEEFINYFDYGYPHPQGENVFAATAEMATCPWKTSNLLLNIGIRGKSEGKSQSPIARDATARIEFDPEYVRAYRLIGYENSGRESTQDSKQVKAAGEIYGGHTVTVLYEIVPETNSRAPWNKQRRAVKPSEAAGTDRLLTLQLRYKRSDIGKGELMEMVETGIFHRRPSRNFDWSAAVAGFAMLLRDSCYKGNLSYELVLELAQGATGTDAPDHRDEFLRLVAMAKILSGE